MKPLRFLFAIRTYAPDKVGGGAKSVQNLAEGLCGRGHEVHIVRLVPAGQEDAAREQAEKAGLMDAGRPVLHFLPLHNFFWPYDLKKRNVLAKTAWHLRDLNNRAAARDFAALVEKIQPDIVNTSIIDGFSTAIFRAAKVKGARLVHTMRDYYLVCQRSGMFRNGHNCKSLCGSCRISSSIRSGHARNVDLFLANSAYVAGINQHFGAYGPEKQALVQWNINERPLVPGPRSVEEGRMVFGFIGRIAPSKGLEKLLDAALMQADREGRDWEVLVAGDGEAGFVQSMKEKVRDEKRIRFMGWSRPEDFYGSIDVLVCPSTYNEPLPRVIYEANGFAIPSISAATGGIPEIIEHGQSGLLYDAEDPASLAEHMHYFRQLSGEEYTRFSTYALDVAQQFSPDSVLDTYEQRIHHLLAGQAA